MRYQIAGLVAGLVMAGQAWAWDGSLTIDGTDQETMKASIAAMVKDMSPDDRAAFQDGFMNLAVKGFPGAKGLKGFALMAIVEPALQAAHITMNGKSLADIMERGESLQAAKQRQEQATRQAAEEKQTRADDARACLVDRVKLDQVSLENGPYGPFVRFTVSNGLAWPISGVMVEYDIRSDGRPVPWDKGIRKIMIKGGLMPGESRALDILALDLPKQAPQALAVVVSLADVADANERALTGANSFMTFQGGKTDQTCP